MYSKSLTVIKEHHCSRKWVDHGVSQSMTHTNSFHIRAYVTGFLTEDSYEDQTISLGFG